MKLDGVAVVSDVIDHGWVGDQTGDDIAVLELIGDIRTVASGDDGPADPQFAPDIDDGVAPGCLRRDRKWTSKGKPDVVGENDAIAECKWEGNCLRVDDRIGGEHREHVWLQEGEPGARSSWIDDQFGKLLVFVGQLITELAANAAAFGVQACANFVVAACECRLRVNAVVRD